MTESACIFCKIAAGEIPADKLYEDREIIAFNDISPVAPTHFLVIPKAHLATLDDALGAQAELLGKILQVGAQIARERGLVTGGYRQVINCGKAAGQEVFHLHAHFIAGRPLCRIG